MKNNNSSKKEITLEDIARTLQEGLLKMDASFANVDKRFNKVDKGFDRLETKLDKVETGLDQVEKKLGNIEADLNKKIDRFEHKGLEFRVEKLEKKLA